jgi:hypothetical protein
MAGFSCNIGPIYDRIKNNLVKRIIRYRQALNSGGGIDPGRHKNGVVA